MPMDLPSRPHRKLPPELNQQIFFCFNPETQRKFICGLGWDFYAMFRHRLLTKTNRVCNPDRNGWNRTTAGAIISRDGLNARNSNTRSRTNIVAEKGFAISSKHSRTGDYPGTIIYYYEVKLLSYSYCMIGLSDGTPIGEWVGEYPNSYAIPTGCPCNWYYLAGERLLFQLPDGAIQPKLGDYGRDVYGCGLVMDPNGRLAIFFTLNGTLLGRQSSICPSVDKHLVPAVTLWSSVSSIEANFGNDRDKPFKYDIKKCPGMGLDCI